MAKKKAIAKPAGERLVDVARTYLRTPWAHQGRLKGLGVDCVGFIAAAAEESRSVTDVEFEQDYRRAENGVRMRELLNDYMDYVSAEIEDAQAGDVIAFCDEALRHRDVPRHLGILTEWKREGVPYVIEASERGVVEHRMDAAWKRRVHSVWRIRE